ncbi:unnamed protein product, partial [Penicillium nalgiovense]
RAARLPKPECHPNTIGETAKRATAITSKPLIIFVSSYLRQRGRNLPYSNVASAHKTITVDISHGAGCSENIPQLSRLHRRYLWKSAGLFYALRM